MTSPFEVAGVFRRHAQDYRHEHVGRLGRAESRVISAIQSCRTAALGGHVEGCDDCGGLRVAYNSCRNRHVQNAKDRRARPGSPPAKAKSCPFPISTRSSPCRRQRI